MGRPGIERKFVDKPVAQFVAAANDLVAGSEPAIDMQVCDVAAHRLDHDVSILITAVEVAGR
jgi:hypothetical protein